MTRQPTVRAWPASRARGVSPVRLMAAATLVVLALALAAGRTHAEAPSAPVAPSTASARAEVPHLR